MAGHTAPLSRHDVTELAVFQRLKKNLTWAQLANAIGQSKEWTTSALLGRQQFSEGHANIMGTMLDLSDDAILLLQQAPYKGSLPTAVPTDPLLYRFYEVVSVYGSTIKELIHEEFGDGIMSAIDFTLGVKREPNDAGDRVNVTLSGKFLPYKKF